MLFRLSAIPNVQLFVNAPLARYTRFEIGGPARMLANVSTVEALAETLQEPEEWARLYTVAIVHHAAGRGTESDEALSQLVTKYANDAAYQIAEVYAMRREADHAFEWLERAYAQRDPGLAWMKVDPLLRSLHADPLWDVFLRRLRFLD